MKFVLVTVNDEKYKPLAEWTVHKNKKKYCEKHGYTLYHLEDGAVSIVGKPMRAGNPPIPDDHVPNRFGVKFMQFAKLCKFIQM
jgi:hypothetical protein